MTTLDIMELKSKQAIYEKRKSELIKVFEPFQKQFFDTLKHFAQEAISKDIRGIKELKTIKHNNGYCEATITLNSIDMVIATTDDIQFLDQGQKYLSSKIFIYDKSSDNEENKPAFEVTFREANDKSYMYSILLFTRSDPIYVVSDKKLSERSGTDAAYELLSNCYRIITTWAKGPPLVWVRKHSDNLRSIGFGSLKDIGT